MRWKISNALQQLKKKKQNASGKIKTYAPEHTPAKEDNEENGANK